MKGLRGSHVEGPSDSVPLVGRKSNGCKEAVSQSGAHQGLKPEQHCICFCLWA